MFLKGAFLGLDNIGVFDRSAKGVPGGGYARTSRWYGVDGDVLLKYARYVH